LTPSRIVLMSADPRVAQVCGELARDVSQEIFTAATPDDGFALIEKYRPETILIDLDLPGLDPGEAVRRAREVDDRVPVILLTSFASLEIAVATLKEGAYAYVPKPFLTEQIRPLIARAAEQRRLTLENVHLREQLEGAFGFEKIIGRSPALLRALDLSRRAAQSDANILILGESGTGKELMARAIHLNSRRAAEAFVAVDCASLPENLLESELFGYERGAFTGAIKSKPGLMEVAHRGTLFLDEIGELPIQLQVKILRAIQERQHRRLGGTEVVDFDARLVCATNRDLEAMVKRGQFRQDLFYRLNVIPIRLPALREREGDIPLLANAFLRKFSASGGCNSKGFDPEVIRIFESYAWPGNVRELQNVVEYACALSDSETITAEDLPEHFMGAALATASHAANAHSNGMGELPLRRARELWVAELEKSYLSGLLRTYGENVSQVARAAGVDRKTMRRLLNKYGLRSS
jgi:DNA-binding NtrC family response regulator